jgi:hypothetical protein
LISTGRAYDPNPALEHADWLDEQPDAAPRTAGHQYSHRPVPLRRPGFATVLVARWVGIVSAARPIISCPVGRSADGGSADAYRHTTTYGSAAVDTGAMDASVIAGAANASAPTAICEGII